MDYDYMEAGGLPLNGHSFNGRNISQHKPGLPDICCNITTPYHIIVMYNTCGLPGKLDYFFSVSPAGADYYIYRDEDAAISPPHRHDYFELMILLKGNVMQFIEGKEYLYTPGSCCLINRNIIHTERFLGQGTILFLGLSNDFVRELTAGRSSSDFPAGSLSADNAVLQFMEENLNGEDQKYYLDFSPVYQHSGGKTAQERDYADLPGERTTILLHEITDRLVNDIFLPRLGVDFRIRGEIYDLLDYLNDSRAFHILPVKLRTQNDTLLFYRIRQLMQDADGRLSRSRLEQILHYSGNYLNNIVKQHTGLSISEYGLSISLEKAAQLLRGTDMTVGEILEQLHFTNQGYFTRLFRERYGMTPGRYRNNNDPSAGS